MLSVSVKVQKAHFPCSCRQKTAVTLAFVTLKVHFDTMSIYHKEFGEQRLHPSFFGTINMSPKPNYYVNCFNPSVSFKEFEAVLEQILAT